MDNKEIFLFVATNKTQGQRQNDFCWVNEGEIVKFPAFYCSNGYTDDTCGCHRSLVGIYCSKSTTTIQVKSGYGTLQDFTQLLFKSYERQGWAKIIAKDNILKRCFEEATKLSLAATCFSIDTIVEWRYDSFTERLISKY